MFADQDPTNGSPEDLAGRTSAGGDARWHATVDERREATRFEREPGTDFAVLWDKPGDEILAEVHDESLSGLGLVLDDVTEFRLGREFHVVYTGMLMRGEVRHIEYRPDGRYLVGLHCEGVLPPGVRDD